MVMLFVAWWVGLLHAVGLSCVLGLFGCLLGFWVCLIVVACLGFVVWLGMVCTVVIACCCVD